MTLVDPMAQPLAMQTLTAWRDLSRRALEPNVLLEPEFLVPALHHLGGARRPVLALVWAEGAGGARSLIGLAPLVLPRRSVLPATIQVWSAEPLSVTGLLLDRDRAAEALDGLTSGLVRLCPWAGRLRWARLCAAGPTAALLDSRGSDLQTMPLDVACQALDAGVPRVQNRVHIDSRFRLHSVRDPSHLRDAAEYFLAMEADGPRGRDGDALLRDSGRSAFARTMLRGLAHRDLCRIDQFRSGDTVVAMAIVIESGDTALVWRETYAEGSDDDDTRAAFAAALVERQTMRRRTRLTLAGRSSAGLTSSGPSQAWPHRIGLLTATLTLRHPAAPVSIAARARAGLSVSWRLAARLSGRGPLLQGGA